MRWATFLEKTLSHFQTLPENVPGETLPHTKPGGSIPRSVVTRQRLVTREHLKFERPLNQNSGISANKLPISLQTVSHRG